MEKNSTRHFPFVRCVFFPLLLGKSIQPTRTNTEVAHVPSMVRAVRRLRAPAFIPRWAQDLNLRVSAVTLPKGTIAPLFYPQSIDLPVLRGRRCVDGPPKRPQTLEL